MTKNDVSQKSIDRAFLQNLEEKFKTLLINEDDYVKFIAYEGIAMIKIYKKDMKKIKNKNVWRSL